MFVSLHRLVSIFSPAALALLLSGIAAAPASALDEDPTGPCYERLLDGVSQDGTFSDVAMTSRFLVGHDLANAHVRVYERAPDGQWGLLQTISSPIASDLDTFGSAIDLEGEILVIGEKPTFATSSPGAAHVYGWDAASGLFELEATWANVLGSDFYAETVSVSDGQVLVSRNAPLTLEIYERDLFGVWAQLQSLTPAGISFDSIRDGDVAGDRYAIVTRSGSSLDGGQLYFFGRSPQDRTWSLLQTVTGQPNVRWGQKIAVSTDSILVSGETINGAGGRIHTFYYDTSGSGLLTPGTTIPNPVGQNLNGFSRSLDVAGDQGVVGAFGTNGHGQATGAAWVLQRSSQDGQWEIGRRLRSRRTNQGDRFGENVAVADGRFAVSAITVAPVGDAWHIFEPSLDADGNSWADGAEVGRNYCLPNAVNGSGSSGTLAAVGSQSVGANDLRLVAENLPRQVFGYVLSSGGEDLIAQPAGSLGNLCIRVDSQLGRYVDQVGFSDVTGNFTTEIDLQNVPVAAGSPIALAAGETWYFQVWYRDGASSNFTNALYVGLLP